MAVIGRTNPYAGQLRRALTDAEQRLWHHLRNRQLAGFKFRRQVTIGRYIADFACAESRIVIEADGGQHDVKADDQRTAYLQTLGWHILRFWNNDILQNTEGVLEAIVAACSESVEGKPSPNPLPPAGED